ncbi:hypothetical protein [Polaribacter sp. BM10]|uniref:hypothetical protein n=1 Tax=Polaribacter sp. BM10 TaxID=1529069 RepID=UPI00098AFB91|nr:hypothetical protein [Polaribacter sp. BM10]AQS92794.1 hypothetical protein BXQ17_01375 [Polaribacter sp. BM10]
MKKVILTLAFIAGITTMNANTNIEKNDPEDDCIAYACEELSAFEDDLGDFTEAEADSIVDFYYKDCMGK